MCKQIANFICYKLALKFKTYLAFRSVGGGGGCVGGAHGAEEEGGAAEGQLQRVHPTLARSVVRRPESGRVSNSDSRHFISVDFGY